MRVPWQVPPIWRGETVFCVASGPSLRDMDLARLRGRRVIVVNDNYLRCPWADILYFCDHKWWVWHSSKPELRDKFAAFAGVKATLDRRVAEADLEIMWLQDAGWNPDQGLVGLDPRPTHLRNGRNGGYQALHLAVHLGARRIVLLGYDMKPGPKGETHWFGEHVDDTGRERPTGPATIAKWATNFETLVAPLQERGIEVLNATPGSAITCFPRSRLEDCLEPDPAALRGRAARGRIAGITPAGL